MPNTKRMEELVAERVPFVHAVVVRAQLPTAVSPGDDAIILSDGSIEGFVGGQCAESSVRTAALGALSDGRTVLLRVLPEGEPGFPDSPGAQVVVNPCLSGGALEIFLQPLLPPPVLWVVGYSPIATALATLAAPLDFTVRLAPHSPGPSSPSGASGAPGVPRAAGHPDAVGPLGPAGATAAVVCSHGRGEQEAIRAALEAGVGYVGLVASHRRGAAVLGEMELSAAERRRIHSPAGLRIGARTAPEIALSILAEIVAAIRTGDLAEIAASVRTGDLAESERPRPGVAVDPVCGMNVAVSAETPHLVADGEDVWFCGSGCRDRFARAGGR